MPRVKGGTVTRARRKKVLKLAKGYYGSKHTLYKVANQAVPVLLRNSPFQELNTFLQSNKTPAPLSRFCNS